HLQRCGATLRRVSTGLEQPGWQRGGGDQHVLYFLVVRHHHQVVLTAQARLRVAAECGVSWVDVVVVDPHTTCLNVTARAVCGVLATGPHAAAKAEVGVIRNLDGFVVFLEGCHGKDWAEDLVAGDLHVIGAGEDGWLNVVTVFQTINLVDTTTDKGFCTFCWADLQVGLDLVHLLHGSLRTHHGFSIQWVANLDGLHALNRQLQEVFCNVLMNQCTRWTCTNRTLDQCEHGEALNTLLQEVINFIHDVLEEDRWGLTAQLQGHWNDALGGALVNHLADWGGTGERNLLDALIRGQRRTGFLTQAVDDVENTRWHNILNLFHQVQDGRWGLLCWLHDDAVTRCQCWRNLPGCHEDWEVPWNDLTHHAEWLVKVVRHGVFINLGQATFLG